MLENTKSGVIVEWDRGKATGFTSKQEAERFIERVCKKTAPSLNYYIYSITDRRVEGREFQ